MKQTLPTLIIVGSLLWGQAAEPTRTGFPPPEQNLRVFRCVLDQRPRCLVFNLSPVISLAWDTKNGVLWRGWEPTNPKLPVALSGAVFDGKHGPQPTHDGALWFDETAVQVTSPKGDVRLRYLGHRLEGEDRSPVLRWNVQDENGEDLGELTQSARIGASSKDLVLDVTFHPRSESASVAFHPPTYLRWALQEEIVEGSSALKPGTNTFTTTLSSK